MGEPYFPYVQKFSTADIGGTDLNCHKIDYHEDIKQKIKEFEDNEEIKKLINSKFNGRIVMDKYPELRGEKLGNALNGFKNSFDDYKKFVLDNPTDVIMKTFDDFIIGVKESVRDMMKPKSEDEIAKSLEDITLYRASKLYKTLARKDKGKIPDKFLEKLPLIVQCHQSVMYNPKVAISAFLLETWSSKGESNPDNLTQLSFRIYQSSSAKKRAEEDGSGLRYRFAKESKIYLVSQHKTSNFVLISSINDSHPELIRINTLKEFLDILEDLDLING
jgi:hypothetical protein